MANDIFLISQHREKDFNFQIGKNNDGILVKKFMKFMHFSIKTKIKLTNKTANFTLDACV